MGTVRFYNSAKGDWFVGVGIRQEGGREVGGWGVGRGGWVGGREWWVGGSVGVGREAGSHN